MTSYHSGHFPSKGLDGENIAPTWTDNHLILPQLLKNANYTTAGIGKLAPLTEPTKSGFDYFIGQIDQGLCHNMYPHFVDSGDLQGNVALPGNVKIPNSTVKDHKAARTFCMDSANIPSLNYTVDITHQHSLAWIANEGNAMRDPNQPFFLYESFTVPHAGGWGWAGSSAGV